MAKIAKAKGVFLIELRKQKVASMRGRARLLLLQRGGSAAF